MSRNIRKIRFDLMELETRDTVLNSWERIRLHSKLAEYQGELDLLKEKFIHELDSGGRIQMNNYPFQAIRQKLRSEDAVLLDYFYGDSLISLHLLTQDTLIAQLIIKGHGFDKLITDFLGKIKQPERHQIHMTDSLGSLIYNAILDPVSPFLGKHNIVIVPDGLLSFIPFEYLLYKRDPGMSVSYEFSSSLYLREPRKSTKTKYVGFAPYYDGNESFTQSRGDSILLDEWYANNRGRLGHLRYNVPEVVEASRLLNGNSYTGENISKSLFYSQVRNAGIIHLALHALANAGLLTIHVTLG